MTLVERLRNFWEPGRGGLNGDTMREAATRIEELEVRMRHVEADTEQAVATMQADQRHIQERLENAHAAINLALPLLIRLGDFIANADGRCEAILAIRDALEMEASCETARTALNRARGEQ